METAVKQKSSANRRIYRFPLWERIFMGIIYVIVVFMVQLLPFTFIMVMLGDWYIIGIVLGIYPLIIMPLYIAWQIIFNHQLVITAKGITVYEHGIRHISYDNMSHFQDELPHVARQVFKHYGIVLKSSVTPKYSRPYFLLPIIMSYARAFFGDDDAFVSFYGLIKVPMKRGLFSQSIDLEKFRKTDFGQGLFYYAPHLFEDAEKPKKHKNRLRDEYSDESQPEWVEELDAKEIRKIQRKG